MQPLETHTQDHAWHDNRTGLFTIRASQNPTHCEWGLGPLLSSVGPPDVAGQLGMRAITLTTLKKVCGP
jgi:hypothetical protein